ncbi:MAG: DUF4189 domain-containing protein [Rhodobacteraceae bacterium]|nr:DUF4189 domain-containing protein [Paracoccaceae bacterium]
MKQLAATILFVFAAGAAAAGQCGYQYCWGAVGIGPNGARAFSHSFASESAAMSGVQAECGGNCTEIQSFYNTCGAMAVATNGGWGFGWGGSRAIAESNALGYCAQNGPYCEIATWACSH